MIIIGHRGARGLAPENTLASIHKALDCGVSEVEVDVRITRDGIPVLNHNRAIAGNAAGLTISTSSLAELRQQKTDLATLQDALLVTDDHAVLLIEVKHGEPTPPVIEVIQDYQITHKKTARIMLGSKSQKTLLELHRALPAIPKVVIEPWSGIRAGYRARQLDTKRISMRSWWLWRGFLRAMHRRGYQMVPYTMNDPAKVARWQPYIYGVVTDFPDRFTSVKGRR